MSGMSSDSYFMHCAREEAAAAARRGDPGFGAVLVRGDQLVASGGSRERTERDPLAQAQVGRIVLGAAGNALERLLGPRTIRIEDLAADYPRCPPIERGLLADPALAVLARSLHLDL